MRARLNHLREALRSSLWFVPSVMSVAALVLAWGMLSLDAVLPRGLVPDAIGFRAGANAARALLTTLAGAMMGVVGVTFSITVVALSLASQQFGPRLLRNFLRDRANHFVLGTFLATFLYSLFVLQAIDERATAEDLPRLSLTVAMLLAVASLAVLIYFVHHIAHGIQADSVIASVARELEGSIDRLYPERMGEETPPGEKPMPEGFEREARVVRATGSGYLQAVEEGDLVDLARRDDLIVKLVHRPGDFVIEDSPLLLVWPPGRLSDDFEKKVRGMVILGRSRTAEQDVEFSIDQLVEVAVRALSPGINDPFTAMRCVDRLGAALCRLCTRRIPSPQREDEEGRLRVIASRPDFGGLVNASFHQIREYGRRSAAVTIRLLEIIELVAGCARADEAKRAALREQVERIWDGAQEVGHPDSDMRDIRKRYDDALAALTTGGGANGVPMHPHKRS